MKNYVVGFGLNLLAGIVLYFLLPALQKDLLLIGFVVSSTVLTISVLMMVSHIHKCHRFGIARLLTSVREGDGSTTSILSTVSTDFAFMGIAARKWVDTGPLLQRVVKTIANPNSPVRFLLLDPDSEEAVRQSRLRYGNEHQVADDIRDSIGKFKQFRDGGCSLEVRVYDSLPVFRIAIVDEATAYLGFYRAGMAHDDSPQLVLNRHGETSYFQPYKEYFETIWKNQSKKIDWTKY
jgi:hypothetical protein